MTNEESKVYRFIGGPLHGQIREVVFPAPQLRYPVMPRIDYSDSAQVPRIVEDRTIVYHRARDPQSGENAYVAGAFLSWQVV